ncbi:thiamine-phosphate pyrophosphorylase [Akanthomyces lecanii RCEF 1005]|uniref:Thiamine-phosphate pyrophosphorylase n=1 Tax=Akanthomyces lecanii RCEF 1005 TaxID=1081108 RepID=A0A168HGI3_CORDF|nr:thiamine-phosphate pyrophosphorylase [Akanthomyces lecanii RCEF 1005]
MLSLLTPKRPTAPPPPPNYGVYLVTDSTPAILGSRDLVEVVEAALRGGVTCVQYRDKTGAQADVVATARRLHALTQRFGVPLLINDRVDVAVEVGCEGIHIGQDDMNVHEARKLVGHDKIIGVTASNADEAIRACEDGADYLGLGTVYSTATKKDTKSIIGPSGVRAILKAMVEAGHGAVPAVCIGGISNDNAARVLAQTNAAPAAKPLDGVAVVSAIIAADDPAEAARHLAGHIAVAAIPLVVGAVVQNFAANVALAVGASPIMSNYAAEAADLAKLGGALVVNMGTVTPEGLANYKQAIKAYNDAGRPIILDPVGAGATAIRRAATAEILALGRFAVIKGNVAEIQTLYGASVTQRGVDSTSELSIPERATLAAALARRHRTVVLLTGPTDIVSDGARTYRVDNGHAMLGRVTGTGCTLGTTISAMVAAHPADALLAAVAGAAVFGIAAQYAVERDEVRGPGSFVPAFLDELYSISRATAEGDLRWLVLARVQGVQVDDEA